MTKRKKKLQPPLERLREIILVWPETDERISHGAPTWWGGKKTFASFSDNHHGDGRIAVWIKSEPDTRETLIQADPDTFFVPPYVGPRGWIGVEVDGDVDWALVAGLLEEGYRSVAPKRALEQLDG